MRCPTHVIRGWNGQFWEDASLSKLGLVIQLGHEGATCPLPGPPTELWVGDLTGFCSVTVNFCQCSQSYDHPKGLQLIPYGIFPCSDISPQSGFTIALLRQFATFSTLAKGSAHKYYAILERSTSTGFPGSLPNCSRELLSTYRRFSYLLLLKRSGSTFPEHPNPAFQDDLALRCPACPNPGVNFKPDEVDLDEQ
jgi:hypothetical protein